jgi:hypothetical protein
MKVFAILNHFLNNKPMNEIKNSSEIPELASGDERRVIHSLLISNGDGGGVAEPGSILLLPSRPIREDKFYVVSDRNLERTHIMSLKPRSGSCLRDRLLGHTEPVPGAFPNKLELKFGLNRNLSAYDSLDSRQRNQLQMLAAALSRLISLGQEDFKCLSQVLKNDLDSPKIFAEMVRNQNLTELKRFTEGVNFLDLMIYYKQYLREQELIKSMGIEEKDLKHGFRKELDALSKGESS